MNDFLFGGKYTIHWKSKKEKEKKRKKKLLIGAIRVTQTEYDEAVGVGGRPMPRKGNRGG